MLVSMASSVLPEPSVGAAVPDMIPTGLLMPGLQQLRVGRGQPGADRFNRSLTKASTSRNLFLRRSTTDRDFTSQYRDQMAPDHALHAFSLLSMLSMRPLGLRALAADVIFFSQHPLFFLGPHVGQQGADFFFKFFSKCFCFLDGISF